jgi:ElaB/YqjD/DUF883 family membrane-anchored ribosome-binding protein/tetrahydromethanopterin S-methyltransferase subunit B
MNSLNIPTPITPIVEAIRQLYGTAKTINDFIDEQIDSMKSSAKEAVQVCGKILEGAKYGFGIGYATSIVAIAIGHLLMGNTLAVVGTLAAGASGLAAFTNPISMTCAAIGAIYYGWNALDEHEKEAIIERIIADFKIGVELIKAIINYVVTKTKELMSSDALSDIKDYLQESAKKFGKTLSDITRNLKDKVVDTAEYVKDKAENVGDFVKERVIDPIKEKIDKK